MRPGLSIYKFILALVTILCLTFLMWQGTIDALVGMPPITLIVGYIVGNGVAFKNNEAVEPIIKARPQRDGRFRRRTSDAVATIEIEEA